jgi:hypothetical protein
MVRGLVAMGLSLGLPEASLAAVRRGFDDRLWAAYLLFFAAGVVVLVLALAGAVDEDLAALAVALEIVGVALAVLAFLKGSGRHRRDRP